MKYEILHRNLLIQFRNRIPHNSTLVTKLVEILFLEREAVYRRLRREVPFTFEEITVIAVEFNISLDSMLGVDVRSTNPFQVQSDEKNHSEEFDHLLLEKYTHALKEAASDSKGEISLITNLLPQLLSMGFKSIFRFYYFKWHYYSIPTDLSKSYHEIVPSDRLNQTIEDIYLYSKNIKTGYYILDNRIIHNFVNDVSYFNSIRLIKDEDVLLIKNELFQFLDYMENVAARGFADNPANKIIIYTSDISIDTTYSYVDSASSPRFILIWSFIFNSQLIYDEETLNMIRHRIRSQIRTSTLLSVAGEKQRTLYFETQRRIVDAL